jgi:hypothetical protein
MKRTIGVAFLLLFFSAVALSQENVFNVGDKVVNVGLGIGNIGYTGSGWKTTIPPLSASFEMGIKDGVLEKGVIGVGGYLGLAGYKWTYSGFGTEYGWKYTNFILGARGTFHYPLIDKFDTYTGLLIGYEIVSVTEFGVNTGWGSANGSGIIWSWYAGGRYYFTEKLGAMVELGYGITYLNLGVCLKL